MDREIDINQFRACLQKKVREIEADYVAFFSETDPDFKSTINFQKCYALYMENGKVRLVFMDKNLPETIKTRISKAYADCSFMAERNG